MSKKVILSNWEETYLVKALINYDIYHLVSRSVEETVLFRNARDEIAFYLISKYYEEKYDVKVFAMVFVGDTYHLLVGRKKNNIIEILDGKILENSRIISEYWKQLNSSYVAYYNSRYKRTGTLFRKINKVNKKAVKTLFHLHDLLDNYFEINNSIKPNVGIYLNEYKKKGIELKNDEFLEIGKRIIADVLMGKKKAYKLMVLGILKNQLLKRINLNNKDFMEEVLNLIKARMDNLYNSRGIKCSQSKI